MPLQRLFVLATLCSLVLSGCSQEAEVPKPVEPPPKVVDDKPKQPEKPPRPDYLAMLTEAESKIAAQEFESAKETMTNVRAVEDLTADEQAKLAAVDSSYKEAYDAWVAQQRSESLEQAVTLMEEGDLEEASRKLDFVLASLPTSEQKTEADTLKRKIEEIRRVRRQLGVAMRQLASEDREQFRAARSRLIQDSEVALPMLLQSLKSDDPVLVTNALEVLRRFHQPDRTTPATINLLADPDRPQLWPIAIAEISALEHPGAGEPLLELAKATQEPKQRGAIIQALSVAPDPPRETLVSLLPLLYDDGPDLAPALKAVYRALQLHEQTDLMARRGVEEELSPEQREQFAKLSERFAQLAALSSADALPEDATAEQKAEREAARAAMAVGIATRQLEAKPIEGIKIVRVSGEREDSAPDTVLDGEWNSIDPAHMWLHTFTGTRTAIVFDLGASRTVSGIRIWNYNLTSYTARGWKEFDIFVDEDEALLSPDAKGLIPPAPGVADMPDYSVTVPVPFLRGRYIKLEPRSVWGTEALGGITEIQILGY